MAGADRLERGIFWGLWLAVWLYACAWALGERIYGLGGGS